MYKLNNCGLPAGMRDWLPPEAQEKRLLVDRLLQKMGLWGYEEISSPLLEYYHVLTKCDSLSQPDNLYKLIERDGSILALRPEMTTPIARIIVSKMPGNPPWRLMYGAEVFRYEPVQAGRQRSFSQVGVELIGESGPQADGEVLALAIAALRSAGMANFTVSLGHMGVLNGLLDSLSWEKKSLDKLRSLILEKDFVGLHQLFETTELGKSKTEIYVNLLTQPLSINDLDQMLPFLPEGIKAALAELKSIIDVLDAYEYTSYIQVDLSTLRSQTYYTGMVFEIYTAGIGYPIGGGGRYDNLLHQFGQNYPSTGFALGIERLLLSLPPPTHQRKPLLLVGTAASQAQRRDLFQRAESLRAEGRHVILELRPLTKKQAFMRAREIGAELLVWQEEEGNGV